MNKIFRKALSIVTPSEKKQGAFLLLLVFFMSLLDIIGIASLVPFLAVLGSPELIEKNEYLNFLYQESLRFGVQSQENFLLFVGISSFIIIIINSLYRIFVHYRINLYLELLRHNIGMRLMNKYLQHNYEFFLARHSDEMTKSLLSELDILIGSVFRPILNMITHSLLVIVIMSLIFFANPLLALSICSITILLYFLLFLKLKLKLSHLGEKLVNANNQRFIISGEIFGGIKDIKLIGIEESYIQRFSLPSRSLAITQSAYKTISAIPDLVVEIIIYGFILVSALFILSISGGFNNFFLGELLSILGVFSFSLYRLKPSATQIFNGISSLKYGHKAINNLYEDLNLVSGFEDKTSNPSSIVTFHKKIEFSNISYSYPESEEPILTNVNFEIKKGNVIGVIGTTGSGKTTFIDILLGLLKPKYGNLIIDNQILTHENMTSWQKKIGYVAQDIFLIDATISENIAFGLTKNLIDVQRVEFCIRIAQIADFIETLPEGLETRIGERGVKLSGGQRQRIGIARALYRNPEIIIFDEATSALDSKTEKTLLEEVGKFAEEKTLIMIAHRLTTLKSCNHIVVFDKGTIKESGSYDDVILSS